MVFDDDIAMAKELIAEYGAACSWGTRAVALKDPAKPWQGTASTIAEEDCEIVFLDAITAQSLVKQWGGNLDYSKDSAYGLMGAVSFDVAIADRVTRADSSVFTLKNFIVLEPNGVPILYLLEFNA